MHACNTKVGVCAWMPPFIVCMLFDSCAAGRRFCSHEHFVILGFVFISWRWPVCCEYQVYRCILCLFVVENGLPFLSPASGRTLSVQFLVSCSRFFGENDLFLIMRCRVCCHSAARRERTHTRTEQTNATVKASRKTLYNAHA